MCSVNYNVHVYLNLFSAMCFTSCPSPPQLSLVISYRRGQHLIFLSTSLSMKQGSVLVPSVEHTMKVGFGETESCQKDERLFLLDLHSDDSLQNFIKL